MSRNLSVISINEIFDRTDGGRTIFENELNGSIPNRPINSLIRTDDHTPSFSIFQHDNKYMFKDYGNGEAGDAIKLIRIIYNLSYPQAIQKIISDLGLKNGENYKKSISSSRKPIKIKKDLLIEWDTIPFTDAHKKYFDKYELDETYLNNNDCWAISKYAIEKKIAKTTEGQYSFVYIHKDQNNKETGKCKILNLGENVNPKDKWKTSVLNSLLWRLGTIPKDCDKLFIVKSLKDCFCLNAHYGLHCIATQNEDATILLQWNYDLINNLAREKIVAFGSDFMAWHNSYLLTYLTDWGYINTPGNVYDLYQIEDFSDFVEHFGTRSLGNLLKLKGHIK